MVLELQRYEAGVQKCNARAAVMQAQDTEMQCTGLSALKGDF